MGTAGHRARDPMFPYAEETSKCLLGPTGYSSGCFSSAVQREFLGTHNANIVACAFMCCLWASQFATVALTCVGLVRCDPGEPILGSLVLECVSSSAYI